MKALHDKNSGISTVGEPHKLYCNYVEFLLFPPTALKIFPRFYSSIQIFKIFIHATYKAQLTFFDFHAVAIYSA